MSLLRAVLVVFLASYAIAGLILLLRALWFSYRTNHYAAPLAAARAVALGALRGHTDLAPIGKLPRRLQGRVIVELARVVSGTDRVTVAELAQRLGLIEPALKQCGSRRWHRRLRGARFLTLLDVKTPAMAALFDDPHPLLRAQAAEWGARQNSDILLRRITALISDRSPACRFTAKDALLRAGAAAVLPVHDYLESAPEDALIDALEVVAGLAEPRFSAMCDNLSRHVRPAVRVAAVRALASIGGEQAAAAALRALTDSDPLVRSAGAEAAGLLRQSAAAPHLYRMLGDSEFEVQRAAALALRALGASGELLLRRAARGPDGAAAQLAKRALT